jgi:DNA-binding protein HU-beta
MTRADLVNAIASKAGITKVDAEKSLKAFIDSVTRSLKKGEKVTLVGFGTFSVVKRAARKGRNPQTGKEIEIKATKVPKFRPGKALKDAVS